jgi:hypothetical protein
MTPLEVATAMRRGLAAQAGDAGWRRGLAAKATPHLDGLAFARSKPMTGPSASRFAETLHYASRTTIRSHSSKMSIFSTRREILVHWLVVAR